MEKNTTENSALGDTNWNAKQTKEQQIEMMVPGCAKEDAPRDQSPIRDPLTKDNIEMHDLNSNADPGQDPNAGDAPGNSSTQQNVIVLEHSAAQNINANSEEEQNAVEVIQPADSLEVRNEARKLRKLLKLYFYEAFKWNGNRLSVHIIYCLIFLIQIVKVSLITDQMYQFGHLQSNFSSVAYRGHLALRHLLLKDWNADWETLPYPVTHGDFAVYTRHDLESSINFAVSRYYNAEHEATGYYVRLADDNMTVNIRYFDFVGFGDTNIEGIETFDKTFSIDAGLSRTVIGHETLYTYNIKKEFEHLKLLQPIKRMLSTTLKFNLHSVRYHENSRLATCLLVKGEVTYTDPDNNGQVHVDMTTLTTRINCKDMHLELEGAVTATVAAKQHADSYYVQFLSRVKHVRNWQLDDATVVVGKAVIAMCCISLAATAIVIAFAGCVFWKTKVFMKRNFRDVNRDVMNDLPAAEYFRFVKLWIIFDLLADIMTLIGTYAVVFGIHDKEWIVETLDNDMVLLGIGNVFAWLSLLRFFKFNIRFHVLFSTIYHAFSKVVPYLICVAMLFFGFWMCGYAVLGPYHVKFETPTKAAETLFALVHGDEMYATFENLESKKTGSKWVSLFARLYIGAYVAIFTIVVLNLLVALFLTAYESTKEYYAEKPEESILSPIEKALRTCLARRNERNESSIDAFPRQLCDFLTRNDTGYDETETLRREILKLVKVRYDNGVVFVKPRTLKAFMEEEDDERRCFNGVFFEISLVWF